MWNYEIVLLGGKSTWAIWATWAPPEANRDPPNANRAIIVVCKWPTHVFRRIHKQKDVSLLVHLWFIMVHYGSLYGSLFSGRWASLITKVCDRAGRQLGVVHYGSLWFTLWFTFVFVHFARFASRWRFWGFLCMTWCGSLDYLCFCSLAGWAHSANTDLPHTQIPTQTPIQPNPAQSNPIQPNPWVTFGTYAWVAH